MIKVRPRGTPVRVARWSNFVRISIHISCRSGARVGVRSVVDRVVFPGLANARIRVRVKP